MNNNNAAKMETIKEFCDRHNFPSEYLFLAIPPLITMDINDLSSFMKAYKFVIRRCKGNEVIDWIIQVPDFLLEIYNKEQQKEKVSMVDNLLKEIEENSNGE